VNLAIALDLAASTGEPWALEWVKHSVLWEIGAGISGGRVIGRAFGWLTFYVSADTRLAKTGDGLIAIAATFVSYGLTEMIQCCGFLAIFITALTPQHAPRDHEFHHEMHDITEQMERWALMVLLVLFGGALVPGLLAPLTWADCSRHYSDAADCPTVTGLIGLIGVRARGPRSWTPRRIGHFHPREIALRWRPHLEIRSR
jgi:hypothetical protein